MPAKKKYNVDTAWFKRRLEEIGMSQRTLADRMHMDIRGLWLRLQGRSLIKPEELKQIAAILEVPFHEVLRRAGVEVEERRVPVHGHIDGEGVVHLRQAPAHYVVTPPDLPEATYGIACRANGTGALSAMAGSTIFVAETEHVLPEAVGRLAVVQPENAPARACVPRPGDQLGTYDLDDLCGNRLATGVRLAWAAPVLWIQT